MLEAMAYSEPVTQRGGQQSGPGGRADQREWGEVESHGSRSRALAEHDGQPPILHRWVERLFDRPPQAVDLVDEEHAAGLESGQKRGDVSLALERRARRLDHRDLELRGDDVGKRGLP